MTWLRRIRPLLFVLGAALAVGSILGAAVLTHPSDKSKEEKPKSANPAPVTNLRGPIVIGTVDSEPSPVPYLLPPVQQSGTVVKVFVTGGQEVKVGDALYEFDISIQSADLESTRPPLPRPSQRWRWLRSWPTSTIPRRRSPDRRSRLPRRTSSFMRAITPLLKSALKTSYKTQNYPEDSWPKRLQDDPNLYKANVDWVKAISEHAWKKAVYDGLARDNPRVYIHEAEAGVRQAQAAEHKAQIAIDLCTIRAKSAGTIERVTIGPGTTLGIGTRDPALWLIPAGKRIVRAEIEAEFAHRVGKEIEGKEVVVFDNTDPRLTYKGKVRTIGGTFLPKRSAGDSLLNNETRVLEAVIEIADPAPANQPPLRVGQRVRVGLGQ